MTTEQIRQDLIAKAIESYKDYRKLGWPKVKAIYQVRESTILGLEAWHEASDKMWKLR